MAQNEKELKISEIKAAFWVAAKDGFRKIFKQAPDTWRGRESRLYRDEKSMIMTHLDPFYYGTMVGVFLFATFRISGSRRYLQFRDKYILRKDTKVSQPQIQQKSEWKSHIEKLEEKQKSSLEEAIGGPMDLFLSVICAFSSAAWLSRPKRLVEDLSQAPLLPGKSLIYTCACPDFIEIYDKNYGESSPTSVDDDLFAAFQAFALNCKARSRVIATRKDSEIKHPDVIPYPGIRGTRHDS